MAPRSYRSSSWYIHVLYMEHRCPENNYFRWPVSVETDSTHYTLFRSSIFHYTQSHASRISIDIQFPSSLHGLPHTRRAMNRNVTQRDSRRRNKTREQNRHRRHLPNGVTKEVSSERTKTPSHLGTYERSRNAGSSCRWCQIDPDSIHMKAQDSSLVLLGEGQLSVQSDILAAETNYECRGVRSVFRRKIWQKNDVKPRSTKKPTRTR